MKHIRKRCGYCKEIFYTECEHAKFCSVEHRQKYHTKYSNLKLSIQRTKTLLKKYEERLRERQRKLDSLVMIKKRVGTRMVLVNEVET